jgi:hypothetical protein
VKALDAQLLEYARLGREIGMLPKSVASQTTTESIFKAVVGKGGSVQTTAVNTKHLHDIEQRIGFGMIGIVMLLMVPSKEEVAAIA